jgi:DNA-binding transcriptional LysR family regulator
MRINFELLDIRAFLAIYDIRNFHLAAEAVGLSQPALSRRIQALEASLGAPLLERSRRGVSPTTIGRELEPLLRRVLSDLESSILASIPTAAIDFLPRVIDEFNQLYPNIRFRILDLSSNEGLEAVVCGEAEFGINILGSMHPDILLTPLMTDPFVLVCRRDHQLAKHAAVLWTDVAEHRLIGVSRESGNRVVLENALAQNSIQIRWAYEVNHVSTAMGLTDRGLGASILPLLAAPLQTNQHITAVPIIEPKITRTIGLLQRRGANLSTAARIFRDSLISKWNGKSKISGGASGSEAP